MNELSEWKRKKYNNQLIRVINFLSNMIQMVFCSKVDKIMIQKYPQTAQDLVIAA